MDLNRRTMLGMAAASGSVPVIGAITMHGGNYEAEYDGGVDKGENETTVVGTDHGGSISLNSNGTFRISNVSAGRQQVHVQLDREHDNQDSSVLLVDVALEADESMVVSDLVSNPGEYTLRAETDNAEQTRNWHVSVDGRPPSIAINCLENGEIEVLSFVPY